MQNNGEIIGTQMTLDKIKTLIKHQESSSIEYKQSMAELDKLGKAICGFLNGQGGVGFLGITDNGQIIGIEVTESTKNKLSSFCNHFDPWPELKIDYILLPDTEKQVVTITAKPPKDQTPVVYKGTPYLRNEAQLKKMPVETYKRRLLNSAGFSEKWESLSTKPRYTLEDLDTEEILRTMSVGLEEKRIPASVYTRDPHEALVSLDLLDDSGQLTHAAIALFAKKMPADYPQCFIRMGRFIDETMNHTLDGKQIRGNLFQLLNEAETFVQKHLPISSRFEPNQMERVDEAALPFKAVREAIINSLIHRDYSNDAGDIALMIFNTHLEIHNIGHLYSDMTIEKLKKRHPSRRRNPKIAQVCYIRKLIERYGSGTLSMIELCEQRGLKSPEFTEAGDGFLIKFYFKEPIGPHKEIINNEKQHYFSPIEKELLDILAVLGKSTLKEIMARLKAPPTDRTIRTALSNLRDRGIVSSEGFGRGAFWFLTAGKNNKEVIRK